ncbi:MAG: hypothetical protein ACKV0T_15275 [Planctomycetales bacterium]
MVVDPRRRQKKLERKAAKRKEQLRAFSQRNPTDVRERFQRSCSGPLVHSSASSSVLSEGIGNVLLSRECGVGQVAFAVFLVDMYCLGVKNVIYGIRPHSQVDDMSERLATGHKLLRVKPECARKLVEGAIEYAHNLGLPPHEDYSVAKAILGSIDGALCPETFEYGKDGKPLFIAGPNDGPERCRQIMAALKSRQGPDGYHYLVPVLEDNPIIDPSTDDRIVRIEMED